jgi:flagellar hook-associated protein 3 FlgL
VRITNQMMLQNAMRGLRFNLEAMARAQQESLTGRRVTRVSDDPQSAAKMLQVSAELGDIDQYHRNGVTAGVRLTTEDTVLTTINDLVTRAKSLGIDAMAVDPDGPVNLATLDELADIREQIISLGNTKVGNEYIFGGGQTSTPPFDNEGNYLGDADTRHVEIDQGVTTETNHTGDPLFTDVLEGLDELVSSLMTGRSEPVEAAVSKLDRARIQIGVAQAEAGNRQQTINDVSMRMTKRTADLLDQMSSLRDVDPTEAAVNAVAAQAALERAYSVVGRTLSTDILKYL